jgi:tRNA C32,U32 (ribose-2'-O)-methylase TrmJ
MPRLNQLFNRADLTEEEIHILRGIAKAMQQVAATQGAKSTSTPARVGSSGGCGEVPTTV